MNMNDIEFSVAETKSSIYAEAKDRVVSPARVCIERGKGFWMDPSMWHTIKAENDEESYNEFDNVVVNDTLGDYTKAVAESIKFPLATAYAFGLVPCFLSLAFEFLSSGFAPDGATLFTDAPLHTLDAVVDEDVATHRRAGTLGPGRALRMVSTV